DAQEPERNVVSLRVVPAVVEAQVHDGVAVVGVCGGRQCDQRDCGKSGDEETPAHGAVESWDDPAPLVSPGWGTGGVSGLSQALGPELRTSHATSPRRCTFSFSRMLWTWFFTVVTAIESCAAISLFDSPCSISST